MKSVQILARNRRHLDQPQLRPDIALDNALERGARGRLVFLLDMLGAAMLSPNAAPAESAESAESEGEDRDEDESDQDQAAERAQVGAVGAAG